jgi:fructose-specific phosphotransferase system IIC component
MTSSAPADLARSSALHVGFACVAMGGWAAFANRTHPLTPMLLAGLIQGLLSGAITLVLKRSLEAMAARLSGPAAFVLPPLATCAAVLAVLLSVHHLAGTPEVWATIAVPYAVSSIYAWIYTASLVLAGRRAAQGAVPSSPHPTADR